jgi:hypothetical protein
MNKTSKIRWTELRAENIDWEMYFVFASEIAGRWEIKERDRWEARPSPVASALEARLVAIAQHGKDGFIDGKVRPGTIVHLRHRKTLDGSQFFIDDGLAFRPCNSPRRTPDVLAEIRFDCFEGCFRR